MSNSDSDLDFESADEGEENVLFKNKDSALPSHDNIILNDAIKEEIIIDEEKNNILDSNNENSKNIENSNINFLEANMTKNDFHNIADIKEQDNCTILNNCANENVLCKNFLETDYNDDRTTNEAEEDTIDTIEEDTVEMEKNVSLIDFDVDATDEKNDTIDTVQSSTKNTGVCEPTQSVAFMLDKLADKQQDGWSNSWTSGWGVGSGWGSSVLAAAKIGVSSLGRELASGLTTVSNKVEAVLDVPTPEEIAHENAVLFQEAKIEKESNDSEKPTSEESDGWGDWEAWPTASTTAAATTGRAVVCSGLQALEQLGRRTMMALEKHDPGLRRTRALLKRDSSFTGQHQNLSAVLREAAEKAQCASVNDDTDDIERKSYTSIFSEMHGSMHLEALELLAGQCETRLAARLGSMQGKQWRGLRLQLNEMRQLLESFNEDEDNEEDDDNTINADIIEQLEMVELMPLTTCEIILTTIRSVEEQNGSEPTQCLAQLTAASVQLLHRIGQAALQRGQQVKNWKVFCTQLSLMVRLLRQVASNIAQRISVNSQQDNDARQLTAVLLEAAHSRGCIQDTALRLLPILQLASLPE